MIDIYLCEYDKAEFEDIQRLYFITIQKFNLPVLEPKTYKIQVDGRDGDIDVTDFYGIHYKNRQITAEGYQKRSAMSDSYIQEMCDKFNGKKVKLMTNIDSSHYYIGRMLISVNDDDGLGKEVSFILDAHPFKRNLYTDEEVKTNV